MELTPEEKAEKKRNVFEEVQKLKNLKKLEEGLKGIFKFDNLKFEYKIKELDQRIIFDSENFADCSMYFRRIWKHCCISNFSCGTTIDDEGKAKYWTQIVLDHQEYDGGSNCEKLGQAWFGFNSETCEYEWKFEWECENDR